MIVAALAVKLVVDASVKYPLVAVTPVVEANVAVRLVVDARVA